MVDSKGLDDIKAVAWKRTKAVKTTDVFKFCICM